MGLQSVEVFRLFFSIQDDPSFGRVGTFWIIKSWIINQVTRLLGPNRTHTNLRALNCLDNFKHWTVFEVELVTDLGGLHA